MAKLKIQLALTFCLWVFGMACLLYVIVSDPGGGNAREAFLGLCVGSLIVHIFPEAYYNIQHTRR